jgi:hypothetical protein
MADFQLWATACESGLWPAGTFARAYAANRKAAIEDAIDADPVAVCVRELMAERGSWVGCAGDLLRFGANRSRNDAVGCGPDWPKNPRALAGRLRRTQTFLRAVGIEIAFSREGHAGSRVIKMHTRFESSVSTVSSVRSNGSTSPPPRADVSAESCVELAVSHPTRNAPVATSNNADGADANAATSFNLSVGGADDAL